MEWILHILGICPDSVSHLDLIDIVFLMHNEFLQLVYLIKSKW